MLEKETLLILNYCHMAICIAENKGSKHVLRP